MKIEEIEDQLESTIGIDPDTEEELYRRLTIYKERIVLNTKKPAKKKKSKTVSESI